MNIMAISHAGFLLRAFLPFYTVILKLMTLPINQLSVTKATVQRKSQHGKDYFGS